MKRRKAIGNAIRTRAEAYLADGTISTEPKAGTKKLLVRMKMEHQ